MNRRNSVVLGFRYVRSLGRSGPGPAFQIAVAIQGGLMQDIWEGMIHVEFYNASVPKSGHSEHNCFIFS
jgi:hypothetical protein